MPKEEFNPRTFFALHDMNGDGVLDQEEVESLLSTEIKKLYDPNNPEDDPNEMQEEYHRMREHIYKVRYLELYLAILFLRFVLD